MGNRYMENILEYLEKTAEAYPMKEAVDDGGISLTWSGLVDLSQRIGTAFCKRVSSGKPIVLLMEKSAFTLAAMFGAVYAGCFYVVVDPEQPPERIQRIFHILEPELVVVNHENRGLLEQPGYSKGWCYPGMIMREKIDKEKLDKIRENSSASDILYGIFTSGSTGMPKGIIVSHRAVIDFISHFVEMFYFTEKDRIGNQAPFDFDVSVKDIYTCVMTGATLVLVPKRLFSIPPELLDYLCNRRVNTLIWAVSALTLVSALKGLLYKVPKDLKRIMFSGEIMPVKQLRMWQAALPDAEFIHLYGPTEITCNCTYYPVKQIFWDEEKLPIGRAIPGRDVFLLDEKGERVHRPKETGEICVAGESLSDGYYHNPEETEKRFLYLDPLGKNGRYYRTGDLGYYDSEGELYFLGRKDFQVKHMGHRIELEEIEFVLEQVDGIEKSCCLLEKRKNKLTAFYYGKAEAEEISRKLKKSLPSYMIPRKYIQVDKLRLNKNGKTDREYYKHYLETGYKQQDFFKESGQEVMT